MASYVPYLLMQAFGALVFAYLTGTLAFKERRIYAILLALGLYLVLFATLTEIWGDRAGWTPSSIGLYVGLVSAGIASVGAGCLLRDCDASDLDPRLPYVAYALVLAAVLLGAGLSLGAEVSDSIVDPGEAIGYGPAGGFSRLGTAGWAMGAPIFLGALLIILSGLLASWRRDDARGLWLLASGVLFMLWPLDLHLGEIPLCPSFMFLAVAMTYLGFQPPKEEEEAKGVEGRAEASPGKKAEPQASGGEPDDTPPENEEDGLEDDGDRSIEDRDGSEEEGEDSVEPEEGRG